MSGASVRVVAMMLTVLAGAQWLAVRGVERAQRCRFQWRMR